MVRARLSDMPKGEGKAAVLIVEDVPEMAALLEQVISASATYQVSASVGGVRDARREVGRRRPALVLLDEVLPGESSGDLLDELVRDGIPVILVTSLEEATHEVPSGALGRLRKPAWDTLRRDQAEFLAGLAALFRK